MSGIYYPVASTSHQGAEGSRDIAQALVNAADQTCPYSKAARQLQRVDQYSVKVAQIRYLDHPNRVRTYSLEGALSEDVLTKELQTETIDPPGVAAVGRFPSTKVHVSPPSTDNATKYACVVDH